MKLRTQLLSCRVLKCVLLACALAGLAWGQQVSATITGRVTDPSGAAITGAKVTATSVERGVTYPSATNAEGYYNIQNLPVGSYNVKVETTGFQTATQSNVALQMNQVAKMDFQLQVGNVETTVEVTSAAPVLQTEQTLLGQVIDSRTDTTLPLANALSCFSKNSSSVSFFRSRPNHSRSPVSRLLTTVRNFVSSPDKFHLPPSAATPASFAPPPSASDSADRWLGPCCWVVQTGAPHVAPPHSHTPTPPPLRSAC